MVIARGTYEKEEMILLGLSLENVRRLVGGEPILLRRETHGDGIPEGWQISIIYGRTEADIAKQFSAAGMITKDTKIHRDPRL